MIRRDEFIGKEKSLWNRIHTFIDEFADNQKGLTQLIQNLHNLINDDESIEDLHVSDNNRHSFLNYSRWNETLQVEIICEYESFQEPPKEPSKNLPPILSSFDQSMSQYENEDGMAPPPKKEQELNPAEKMKQRDETYKKMRPFRIIIPAEYKMKAILRNIMANLKNADSNRLNIRGRGGYGIIDKIGLSGILGQNSIRALNNLSDDRAQNASNLIIEDHVPEHHDEDNEGEDHRDEMMEGEFDEEDESDSEIHRPGEETKQDFRVKLLPNQTENDEIDLNISIEDWIKRRIKLCQPPKTYEKAFSDNIFKSPNILKFTISENLPKDDKADSDEEMIGDLSGRASVDAKMERGYSLYAKNDKYKKSLQDKELERVIQRDIQSNEKIQEQLGDSCKLLELMKFIFLLKSNNFKAILKSHYDS